MGLYILATSLLVQLAAVVVAGMIAWINIRRSWLLITSAILLMALHRTISFYQAIVLDRSIDLVAEAVALLISLLMLVGLLTLFLRERPIVVPSTTAPTRGSAKEAPGPGATAALLGILILLSVSVVAYWSYSLSRNVLIQSVFSANLRLAQSLATLADSSYISLSPSDRIRFIEDAWAATPPRYNGSYVCVTNSTGYLLLNTRNRSLEGQYVGDRSIRDRAERYSELNDLIEARANWVGWYTSGAGETQIASFAYSSALSSLIGVHVPKKAVESEILGEILPLGAGLVVVVAILLPAALGVLYRAYGATLKDVQSSEARYRAVVEDQTELICRHLPDGTLTFVNDAYCRCFDRSRDELVGQKLMSTIAEQDHSSVQEFFASLGPSNPVATHEHRVVTHTGDVRWQSWTNRAILDDTGKVGEFQGTGRDITERKRVEEALRRSEERLDLAVRGTSDGLWDADLETGKEYWSPRFKEMLGYGEDEIEATHDQFLALLHPDDKAELLEAIRLHLEENQPYDREFRMQTKCGKYCWVQSRGEALRDKNGRPYRMAGSIRDISRRKRIEAALQESEERLRLMMQQSPSVIEVYDVNGLQVDVNKAYEDLWGFPADHTVNLFNVLESEQVEATGLMAYVKRAYAGEPVKVPEYEFDSRGETEGRGRGRIRWLNTRIYPLKDSEGTVRHIVITHEDITDRKCAEEERRALEAQLGQSQKMEAVGQLAGGVAHDFNNILTAIVGYTELSLRSVLRAELADDSSVVASLEAVLKAVFRAASLTKQLLVFSRHDVARPVVLSIHASLAEMEQMLRRLIPADIVLEVEGAPDLGHVRADSGQIEQVIMNLVVNARDAMPEGGKVTLRTANVELDEAYVAGHPDAAVGPHVMLAISDTGCGIEESNLERVFEPFYTTKPPGSGTGLGLAMVHAIIKRAGGHITVDSEVGRGASFRVYLPTVDEPIQEDRPGVATAVEHTGQETLLVCEDNMAVRNMIIQVLREAGYAVLGAETATQAIDFAKEIGQALNLLITDVVMPEMNGMKLSETLTAALPKLRTLFISGYTSDIVGPHAVLGERIELLEKPFGRHVLLQRVRDVLDKPEKADA